MIRARTLEKLKRREPPMVILVDSFENQVIVRVGEMPPDWILVQRNEFALADAKKFLFGR